MGIGGWSAKPRDEAGMARDVPAWRERIGLVQGIEADLAGERCLEAREQVALVR